MSTVRVRSAVKLAASAAVLAAVAATTACGSTTSTEATAAPESSASSDASTAPSQASSASAAQTMQEKAAAAVAAFKDAPTTIGITEPVGKAIPSGKNLVVITAGPADTPDKVKAIEEAADVLGWTVKVISPESPTPQLIQQALQQAAQLSPDAIYLTAVDLTPLTTQLADLKDQGIHVVNFYGFDDQDDQVALSFASTADMAKLAATDADAALSKIDTPGPLGVVTIEGYATTDRYAKGFTDRVAELCPECTTVPIVLSLASLGGSAGTDIVNAYRATPDMKALFLAFDGLGGALYPAAEAAGVDLPPVYSIAPRVTSLGNLESGDLTASMAIDETDMGWRSVDALARLFTGQPESAKESQQLPTQIWSKEYGNVPALPADGFQPVLVPDYKDQYIALWGK